jgi:hypothetical protein
LNPDAKNGKTDVVAGRRRRIRLRVLAGAWLVLIVVLFQTGYVGDLILKRGAPLLLPLKLDDGFEITSIKVESLPVVPPLGIRVTATPKEVKKLLRSASLFAYLLPPGLIRNNLVIHGKWVPRKANIKYTVPLSIYCNKGAGTKPYVVLRYPFEDFNVLLKSESAERWRDEDDYFLGTYTHEHRIWFKSLFIRTITRESRTDPIRLTIRATGRLRYKVQDGIIKARISGDVRELSGEIQLVPVKHKNGIGFDYSCRVDVVKLSVKKMAPWVEKRLSKTLKKSITRSMNKRKRLKRFAQMRLPEWVPLDTVIDIQLTRGGNLPAEEGQVPAETNLILNIDADIDTKK